jgi:hypothetical protein
MSLDNTEFFESKRAQFNAEGSNDRFQLDYIAAVNHALDEYSIKTHLSSHPTHISGTDGTIDIDANEGFVLSAGVDRWLLLFGHFKSGDLTVERAEKTWEAALATARVHRDFTTAAEDDEEESIGDITSDD